MKQIEQAPKIIPLWHFEPNGKTFEILARIKNDPGSLAALLGALAREGIDIIESLSYSKESIGVWIGFVRHKKIPLTSQGLHNLVMSSPSTISCEIGENVNGMLIENLAFPITAANGDREIIIGAEFMKAMMRKLREEFQSASDVLLYREGVAFGEIAEKRYVDLLGRERLLKSLNYVYPGLYSAFGWARVELVSVNIQERQAIVRLYDNFECPIGHGGKASSHFVRGFLNGTFSVLMEAKTSTLEVKCVTKGDKYCEFQATGT